jgi:hypothetical protein
MPVPLVVGGKDTHVGVILPCDWLLKVTNEIGTNAVLVVYDGKTAKGPAIEFKITLTGSKVTSIGYKTHNITIQGTPCAVVIFSNELIVDSGKTAPVDKLIKIKLETIMVSVKLS